MSQDAKTEVLFDFPLGVLGALFLQLNWNAAMKRWAWNIFCALSLLIFATSATLWVRSYVIPDRIYRLDVRPVAGGTSRLEQTDMLLAFSKDGSACIGSLHEISQRGSFSGRFWFHDHLEGGQRLIEPASPNDRVNLQLAGFQLRYTIHKLTDRTDVEKALVVPIWLFLIFALPPLLWWRQFRKRSGQGFPIQRASPPAPITQI